MHKIKIVLRIIGNFIAELHRMVWNCEIRFETWANCINNLVWGKKDARLQPVGISWFSLARYCIHPWIKMYVFIHRSVSRTSALFNNCLGIKQTKKNEKLHTSIHCCSKILSRDSCVAGDAVREISIWVCVWELLVIDTPAHLAFSRNTEALMLVNYAKYFVRETIPRGEFFLNINIDAFLVMRNSIPLTWDSLHSIIDTSWIIWRYSFKRWNCYIGKNRNW